MLTAVHVVAGISVFQPAIQRDTDVKGKHLVTVIHLAAAVAGARVLVVAVVQAITDAIPAIAVTGTDRTHGTI
ncbi:hypothetical protein D3C80_1193600 [compost metagenome]